MNLVPDQSKRQQAARFVHGTFGGPALVPARRDWPLSLPTNVLVEFTNFRAPQLGWDGVRWCGEVVLCVGVAVCHFFKGGRGENLRVGGS